MAQYKIKNNTLILRDKNSAKEHIRQGDYFGTSSAILKLLSEDKTNISDTDKNKYLKQISEELDYLQNNYQIIKKP